MGIVFCIMFGLIGGWVANSINLRKLAGGATTLLLTGVGAGLVAAFIGSVAGWGIKGFNLLSVFLSIFLSAVFIFAWHKIHALVNPAVLHEDAIDD